MYAHGIILYIFFWTVRYPPIIAPCNSPRGLEGILASATSVSFFELNRAKIYNNLISGLSQKDLLFLR
jgi:hypothetical protein